MSDEVKERIERGAIKYSDTIKPFSIRMHHEHGYIAGATSERPIAWDEALEEVKILFDTKLLPLDPVPTNILKIAKAVSEIYEQLEKLKHKQP